MFPAFLSIKLFLIRHGESEANVNHDIRREVPDRLIQLTAEGEQQAHQAGSFLSDKIVFNHRSLIFKSPYKRAIQTADIINSYINLPSYEDDRIVELNHGCMDYLSGHDAHNKYKEQIEYIKAQKENKNTYFTKQIMGESPFDISLRFHSFWADIENKYIKTNCIDNLIIVSHGETINVMRKVLLNETVNWYENEETPENCSIRLLELHNHISKVYDRGYIFLPN